MYEQIAMQDFASRIVAVFYYIFTQDSNNYWAQVGQPAWWIYMKRSSPHWCKPWVKVQGMKC